MWAGGGGGYSIYNQGHRHMTESCEVKCAVDPAASTSEISLGLKLHSAGRA